MCSPLKQGAHFRNTIFTNVVCMTKFPCPKWSRNRRFGVSFPSRAVEKTTVFVGWAENGPSCA